MTTSAALTQPAPVRIVIVGAGCVGLHTARALRRRLRGARAHITVVDPRAVMTYQPFLAEVAGGAIEPRHAAVPLRRALRGCQVLTATVTGVDLTRRRLLVRPPSGPEHELDFDHLVLAPGSVSRPAPAPGLAQRSVGFHTLDEAVHLRDHVLSRLDAAAATTDPAVRRRALSFIFVGGGYSGVEALAELQDLTRHARRYYPELDFDDLQWILVESDHRILPGVSPRLADYTVRRLAERGVRVRLDTAVTAATDDGVELSDGTRIAADTLVWTGGVRPNPLIAGLGLPVDVDGRLECTAQLRVVATDRIWAAGDCAGVPDLSHPDQPGARCAPTAQHAVRQARRLAANLAAALRGRAPRSYRHTDLGSVASLGLHRGMAQLCGLRVRGLPAWLIHRIYHLAAVPTVERKLRVLAGWLVAGLVRRDVARLSLRPPVSTASSPRARAAGPVSPTGRADETAVVGDDHGLRPVARS